MPEPGEPHRPERDHFASDNDYLDALEQYTRILYPSAEIAMIRESSMGIPEIEQYLEDHRG